MLGIFLFGCWVFFCLVVVFFQYTHSDTPKLKMLEKYYVVYQRKTILPKQIKQMLLMYKLKEAVKE